MDQTSKEKTLEHLTKAENILIAVSKNLSFDGLASSLALYLSLIKLGKNVSIIAPNPSVGDAQKIYGVDKIGKTTGKKNLVLVVDDAVQNVDKVTYYLEGNRLKVIIHSLPGTQGIKQEQVSFEELPTLPEVIFAFGFNSRESLYSEITHGQQITSETWLISVNKTEMQQKFAQINIVDLDATSICEITARMVQNLALPVDEDIAFNLYQGIIEATDNFSPAKVTPLSLEIAAWLVKFGAGKASFASGDAPRLDETSFGTSKIDFFEKVPDIAEVESGKEHPETISSQEWLNPPKIYKGSKSFDREN